jgi:superfamily II DNA or RNA helicase
MFNEGVDVPNIDTVLMLRPTESTVTWLQQFGRGLRRCEGKKRLIVIDYIGNHRTFLTKARALLRCSKGDRALAFVLEELRRGEIKWPEGCEVTYDLKALDLLEGLLKGSNRGDALEAYYLDFRERTGERPKALDIPARPVMAAGWTLSITTATCLGSSDRCLSGIAACSTPLPPRR